MQRGRKMKIMMLLCFVVTTLSSKTLNYKFKIKKGQPELQVTKSDKSRRKKHSLKHKARPLTDMEMIKINPTMAPMIELGDILKEFTKTMKQHKRHKKHKKHKKKRKLKIVKSETKNDQNSTENNSNVQDRKAFIGGMSTGASAALVGGGALAAGVGAGMAMGAAQNEGIEHEIGLRENELGIMKIREKVDDDINQELFSSGIRLKGLREKAKTVLANGEAAILEVESSLDNTLGNLMAMDHAITNHLKG